MTTRKHPAAAAVTLAKKASLKKTPAKKTLTNKSTAKKLPAAKTQAPEKAVAATVAKTQAEPAPKQAAKKPKKNHKVKVVRDSFTMPQSEYQKIADIKETCLEAGLQVKKSEVLRAGLKALCEMSAAQLKQSLSGLEKIRTGRPKKHKG